MANSIIFRPLAVGVILLSALAAFGQREYSIAGIQGDKDTSPRVGEHVRTTGIVTARTRNGFFIQTPDDKVDDNPNTSEALFVFTSTEPAGEAAVGNHVSVTGQVAEFRPRSEPNFLPITQVTMQRNRDMIQVLSRNNELPKAVVLSMEDFKSNSINQLEKYEGMRVTAAELTVVAPTKGRYDLKNNSSVSDGVFYGVLKGLPKPFREPGYDVYEYLFMPAKEQGDFKKKYPSMRLFDSNPERLRIESMAQLGSQAIDVPAHTELKNVTGVLYYAYRTYTIFTDPGARPAVSSYPKQINLPPAGERQFSVAGMNVENLFDDIDDPEIKEDIVTTEGLNQRFRKISNTIRNVMMSPDVIGIVEAENLAVLKRLAERINADAVAAGKPDPKYEAHLVDGNDGRGIDVGYLVKASRVKVIETKQLGRSDQFKRPDNGREMVLNDRPPLMLRASIADAKTGQPFEFTVLVNHLKSFLGYNDEYVRVKKRLQAEFLAKWVQERQKANPQDRIILVGDFNAFQFNDGIVDMMGTIKGKPAQKEEVLHPSPDLVDPDMINLVELIAAGERYSYRFDGNGQVLDHILVSDSLKNHIHGFGYARVNADYPEIFRNDETRAERFSDHDPAVAYFNFESRAVAAPAATPAVGR